MRKKNTTVQNESVKVKTKAKHQKYSLREIIEGYAFILPWLIGFIFLQLGPMLFSFIMSFTDWKMINIPKFVGLDNYKTMFVQDALFKESMQVTLKYVFFSVSISLVVALLLAMLLNQNLKGMYVFRTIFYIPSVVSGVALSLVWVWFLNGDFGILNYLLSLIGIKGPDWLGDPSYALWSLIIMSVFGVGGTMVIFLAGLQNIPMYLYESAMIDGANSIQRFFKITLPMLSPTILFNLVTMIIGAFRTFTQVYIITDGSGGPLNSTMLYALYLYKKAFKFMDMGYASAMAWVLFAIVLILTLLIFKSSKVWVFYETEKEDK